MEKTQKIGRHCAYCLVSIAGEAKCCSQCHRRAYCSRKCQSKDWSSRKGTQTKVSKGQGHKDWCGVLFYEEDIEWKVTEIEGKGRGIVAKTLIIAGVRILVESFGVNNVMKNVSKSLKTLGRSILINHACDANAAKMVDTDFKAMIIYAKRDIQPGEEITVNYIIFNETYRAIRNHFKIGPEPYIKTQAQCRQTLETKWGIVCPSDCFCRDEEVEKLIVEDREHFACLFLWDTLRGDKLDEEFKGMEVNMDLEILKRLMDNYNKIKSAATAQAELWEQMFLVAVQEKDKLDIAKMFIEEAHEIWSFILHPESTTMGRIKEYLDDPSKAKTYLALEGR